MNETGVITIRYWASARNAAGVGSETLPAEPGTTLSDVRRELACRHPDGRLTRVLDSCSVLLGDRPVATENPDDVQVPAGSSLEFLPPFAGG